MQNFIQDIRYALRQLRKAPGFAVTVVLTLALGIGANAAIFSLFDQVLLRLLPVEKPKELVRFRWSGAFSGSMSSFGGDSFNYFSYPMYKDLREQNQVFTGVLAADRTSLGISWHNQAENRDAEVVSGNYFQVLGLSPAMGRLFTAQDETAKNANAVAVLSYDYWRAHFGASPEIVGQTILVNGHPFMVIGVAPAHFDSAIGGYRPALFVPVTMVDQAIPWRTPIDDLTNHHSAWLTLVARLKPGVPAAQAQASLASLWHALRQAEFSQSKNTSERYRKLFVDESHLTVLDDSRGFSPGREDLQKPLVILMSMAGLLVVMCAINVATLLLLRASARAREMSLRYALGARRSRVTSQLFTEGGILGLSGAAAGLILAPMIARTLVRVMTNADAGAEPFSTAIDARVLLFTLAISVLASIAFSIAPVLHFFRPNLAGALRQTSGTFSMGSQRFRKIAVGAQIGLTVLLLGCAGLFVRTLDNLRQQQVGYALDHLVTFNLDPSSSGYGADRTQQIVTNSLAVLNRIPGVVMAAASTDPEMSGDTETSNYSIQGYKASEDEKMNFEEPRITAGFFSTLKQPILAGREFTDGDAKGSPSVAVVNLTFAKRFFGSAQNAIGRLIAEGAGDKIKYDITIVGVVGDTRHTDLRTPLGPAVYEPYLQMKHPTGAAIYLRATQSPQAIEGSVRQAMRQLDSTLVVDGLRTMEEQAVRSASDERALALLAIGFSVLAMVLAAVGLYGVLAYSTEQRTREIGVRLALGAQRASVVVLVLREMLIISSIAVAAGLAGTVGLAKVFSSQLYGVAIFDPIALAMALGMTAVTVLVASALPARRAAGVQPMRALRTE